MRELSAFLQVTALLLVGAFLEYTLRTKGLVTDDALSYFLCLLIICVAYLRQLNKE